MNSIISCLGWTFLVLICISAVVAVWVFVDYSIYNWQQRRAKK